MAYLISRFSSCDAVLDCLNIVASAYGHHHLQLWGLEIASAHIALLRGA